MTNNDRNPTNFLLPWNKSLVTKAAFTALCVLIIGYIISMYVGIQNINTLSRLIHDEEVSQALNDHLTEIKASHDFQRQLIIERVRHIHQPNGFLNLSKAELLQMIAKVTEDLSSQEVEIIRSVEKSEKLDPILLIEWLGRNNLRIGDYVIEFKKGKNYEKFTHVQQLGQKYQLVGSELHENIRQTMVYTNAIGLLFSFLLLAILFFLFARQLRGNLKTILEGFSQWAKENTDFRFQKTLPGELGLITEQFNAMAKTIELNRQKALSLEKIASWQVIARKMAHEIKNPLTPIQMMVSQIVRQYPGPPDERYKKLLDQAHTVISEEVASLRRMVDHFSNFAKLPSPSFKPVDLIETCQKVVELQKIGFSNHHIFCTHSLASAVCQADDDLLRQVLINLIKNAAEANENRKAEIEVCVTDTTEYFMIEVCDDGPGIPEELLKRIFEAYVTTKHTGPSPGMGLGLAICQKIILEHKGDIKVTSSPGRTSFLIKLPKQQN